MRIPTVKGALQLDVGAASPETHVRPDGKEIQLRALGRPDGLEISAFLQNVEFPASAEKCRNAWWPGTKNAVVLQRDDLEESLVKEGIARVEFIIPEFQGIKVRQKNMFAYMGDGELCAEVHLSKAGFKKDDQRLFEQVLSSLTLFTDDTRTQIQGQAAAKADDAWHYFALGSQAYLKPDYQAAADSYQRALDLEKQNRTLSKDHFRVLVDNLGMSYALAGKMSQAKATFEYGVTQDPEYPMF
jgi:tetratricopeptide (TPR) repeat protein